MRLLISHSLPVPLELPLSYHHILQGILYNNLSHLPEFSATLHNQGYEYGKRAYRLFAFSTLTGPCTVKNKRITFRDHVSFQVTSLNTQMLQILAESLLTNGITYIEQHYDDVQVLVLDTTIESEDIQIHMLSPISVYETDPVTRHTHFYAPMDPEFEQALNDNFARKYAAYYGVTPHSAVRILPVRVSERDKYVTYYKNFMITGWKGTYRLQGERKYLDFLFQTGLGGRNSQGFGMFEEVTD